MTADHRRVVVVLDPDYGERLRDIWPKYGAWVVGSPANHAVMQTFEAGSDLDSLPLLTETKFTIESAEEKLLSDLYMIDLHHGPYSSRRSYTVLEAIGAPLTPSVRAALAEYGFTHFSDHEGGFVAQRSEDEAARIRG